MFHLVSDKWFRKTQVIPEYVVFYNVWGILLGGCLTVKNQWGVTHKGMMGEGDYWEQVTPPRMFDIPEV